MTVDLHMHSHCSDGALSPTELVDRAHSQGVELLALTDHDTLAGLSEARAQARLLGVGFVNGIEFSSRWGKIGVHIVGLGVDDDGATMRRAVAEQSAARGERNRKIAEKLSQYGVHDPLARAQALAPSGEPGRPHFAQLLVADGLVPDVARAFKKILGAGKPGDIKLMWPPLAQVVRWINDSGGVAVLAHPAKYGLTRTKLRALVADFCEAGGEAMEVISGRQVSGVADNLASIAREFELEASVGSDFHKPGLPWQELGKVAALPAGLVPVWQRLGYP